MPVVACSKCHSQIQTLPADEGRKITCPNPHCGHAIAVPMSLAEDLPESEPEERPRRAKRRSAPRKDREFDEDRRERPHGAKPVGISPGMLAALSWSTILLAPCMWLMMLLTCFGTFTREIDWVFQSGYDGRRIFGRDYVTNYWPLILSALAAAACFTSHLVIRTYLLRAEHKLACWALAVVAMGMQLILLVYALLVPKSGNVMVGIGALILVVLAGGFWFAWRDALRKAVAEN